MPVSPAARRRWSLSRAVASLPHQEQLVSTKVDGIPISSAISTACRRSSKFRKGSPPVKCNPWFRLIARAPQGLGWIRFASSDRSCSRSSVEIQSAFHLGEQAYMQCRHSAEHL